MKSIVIASFITSLILFDLVASQSPTAISGAPTYVPQNSFPWKNKYPTPLSVPEIKPEWTSLVKNDTVPPAPVNVAGGDGSLLPPAPGANDTYCHWSFYQCLKPTDVAFCEKGNWALTYDDGPSPYSTKLYDYLEQNNIKATFFVIGGQVIQYPELLKRLHDNGHIIGLHTWSHKLLTSQTNEEIIAELKWTELAVKEVIGVSPVLMRPPYGDIDDRVREVLRQLGFIPVIWGYDSFDWKLASGATDATTIENSVKAWAANASTATQGGISLEHDITQAGVDVAIKSIPVLKGAYNLTLTSQCANLSQEAVYKESQGKSSSSSSSSNNINPNGSSSNDGGMDSIALMKTSLMISAIALLVILFL